MVQGSRTRNSFAWLYDVIQMLIVTMIVLIYWPWSVSLAFQLAFLEQLQVELGRVLKLREKSDTGLHLARRHQKIISVATWSFIWRPEEVR